MCLHSLNPRQQASVLMRIRSSTVLQQCVMAVALLSVIPILGLAMYALNLWPFSGNDWPSIAVEWIVLLLLLIVGCCGFMIIRGSGVSAAKLKRSLQNITSGKSPDKVDLSPTSDDFMTIETCINDYLEEMTNNVDTIRERARLLGELVNSYNNILQTVISLAEDAMHQVSSRTDVLERLQEIENTALRAQGLTKSLRKKNDS